MNVDDITLKDIEFDYIREVLKGLANTEGGKRYFDNFVFFDDRNEIEQEYQYVWEAISVIQKNEDISLSSLTDIKPFIAIINKGGIIAGTEILAIRDMISLIRQIRSYVRSRREELPSLYRLTENLERYDELFSVINKVLDERGIIRDDCSEKLSDLRIEVIKIREKIIDIIDNYLKGHDFQKILMDSYYTIRNNRYVLPIKTQFKNSIKGIIHGSSNTGETLFIEPEPIISLGNELVYAESMVAKEEEVILRELCEKIYKHLDKLISDYNTLIRFDIIFAKARYSLKISGIGLNIDDRFELIDIRHPILVLRNQNIVSNSVCLEEGVRGVIISGPNAGGKTVLLKSIGLALLHTKLGLFFPAHKNSKIMLFNNLYTCFGDAQNLEEGLSTFTGHIRRLKYILDNCSENDLVLLDEIASDTDPKEGSALSASIIEAMIRKGAFVFVTTHFHELRLWAVNRKDIVNGAMGFDPVLLKPTYKFIMGVSGESYTLKIAKDMGLPDEIIENANKILGEEYREFVEISNLIKKRELELSQKIAELETEKKRYKEEFEALIEREKSDYQRKLEEFENERKRIISGLEEFYNKVSAEIARIQKESDMKKAVSLQREVKEFINKHKEACIKNDKIVDFKAGDTVFIDAFKSKGIILEYDSRKNRHLVNIKGKNVWIDSSDIKKGVLMDNNHHVTNEVGLKAEDLFHSSEMEYQKEIDVRGLYLEDALSVIEKELDSAYGKSLSCLKIIHGHGTGSLKIGIRKYLRTSPYVSAFRPAEQNEGGDGVTIVEIKKD